MFSFSVMLTLVKNSHAEPGKNLREGENVYGNSFTAMLTLVKISWTEPGKNLRGGKNVYGNVIYILIWLTA